MENNIRLLYSNKDIYDFKRNLDITLDQYVNKLLELNDEDLSYNYKCDLMLHYFNKTLFMNTNNYMARGAIVFERETSCKKTINLLNKNLSESIDIDTVSICLWANHSITIIGFKNNRAVFPEKQYRCFETGYKISDKLTIKQIYDIFNSVAY